MTAEQERTDLTSDAVGRIRRSAPPAEGWPRVLARHRRRTRRRLLAPTLAAVALGLTAFALWPIRQAPPAPAPDRQDGLAFDGGRPEAWKLEDGWPETFQEQQIPPPDQPRGVAHMGVWASPRVSVAGSAPVFATTADKQSLPLGGKTPAGELPGMLQVWDWDASPKGRPLGVQCDFEFAVTPDGKAVLCYDGRLVDAATGKITNLPWWGQGGLKINTGRMQFSPDGKTLIVFDHDGKAGTARLIDFTRGKELATVAGLWWAMPRFAFSADNKVLAVYGSDARVHLCDAATGKELKAFEPKFENSVSSLAVSPDGSKVAGCCRGTVRLWDAATGKLLAEPDASQDYKIPDGANVMEFSPDGKLLAGGGSQNLSVWDAATGKRVHRFNTKSGGACHVRWDAASKLVTVVAGHHIYGRLDGGEVNVFPTVSVWDVGSGAEVVPKP